MIGGQLGFIASEAKELITIYITTKLICGFLAVIVCIIYMRIKNVWIKEKGID